MIRVLALLLTGAPLFLLFPDVGFAQPASLITVAPQSLSFSYAQGTQPPAVQSLAIGSTGSSLGYSASAETDAGGGWLSVSPSAGATPNTVNVSVSPAGLAPGVYSGTVTILASNLLAPKKIPVTLTVTAAVQSPALTVTPLALSFGFQAGSSTAPPAQLLSIGSGGAALSFAASTPVSWLQVTPNSGATPATLSVSVTPQSLTPGDYSASLLIASGGASNSPQTVSVSLHVGAAPNGISLSTTVLNFDFPNGVGISQSRPVTVSAGGTGVIYSTSVSTETGSWLSVIPLQGITPGVLAVRANPVGLSPGVYKGSVTVTSATNSQTIQVTMTVGVAGPRPSLFASPLALNFSYRLVDAALPSPQEISVFSNGAPISFLTAVSSASWLSVSLPTGPTPNMVKVSVNPANLVPGVYTANVSLVATGAAQGSLTIPVVLNVADVQSPALAVTPPLIFVPAVQGGQPELEFVQVLNTGSGTLPFTVSANTLSGSGWLNVDLSGGSITSATPVPIRISVDPSALAPGTYQGLIAITAGAKSVNVPVLLLVSSRSQSLVLSEQGLEFSSGAPGTPVPTQTVSVINRGEGTLNWTATVEPIAGGADWISAAPLTGASAAHDLNPPKITVSVNPSGLAPGRYYAWLRIASSQAENGTQAVVVVLNVPAVGQYPSPSLSTYGVLLVGAAGASASSTETLKITNLTGQSLSYASTVTTDDGAKWLSATPATGAAPTDGSGALTIQANLSGLPAGVYHGDVRVGFSDGSVRAVRVTLLATDGPPATGPQSLKAPRMASCQPKSIVTQMSSLEPGFVVTAQQSADIRMRAVDNCGAAMTTGATHASFSNGDKTLSLAHIGDGNWTGTWQPSGPAQPVLVSITAVTLNGINPVFGQTDVHGAIAAPKADSGAIVNRVVNSASLQNDGQVAPGIGISIFGQQLGDGSAATAPAPYPNQVGGVQAYLNNVALPLQYVSNTQVNALIPNGATADSQQQLTIRRGDTLSVPVNLAVADALPAIYAINQQGTGQGSILIANSGILAAPSGTTAGSKPVSRGGFLEIYATGLGTVSNAPADGAAAPGSEPLARTAGAPIVTIGGVQAPVLYSGLAPGLVGVYQVNVQVPTGAPAGNAVPVTITSGTYTSNTVTIAVQ